MQGRIGKIKVMNKEIRTSRKNKFFYNKEQVANKIDNFYSHMFFEDLAYHIIFSLSKDYNNFISIDGQNKDTLKSLLVYRDYNYLRYEFNR